MEKKKTKRMLNHYFRVFEFFVAFSLVLVNAQDEPSQSGFISLDCGRLPKNASYSETTTGINYISDEAFIDTGESKSIAPGYKNDLQEQVTYLRTFPEGSRNCYRINVTQNTKYLIRALFVYGNYDGLNQLPEFDIHLGVSYWATVSFLSVGANDIHELVHVATQDFVHICLVNTGSGTPFISALEFRPLRNTTYSTATGSLSLLYRVDVGASENASMYRYPDDIFDRLWLPYTSKQWTQLTTSSAVITGKIYQPPSKIMSTAGTLINEDLPIKVIWDDPNPATEYYHYLYFAELQQLKANESRSFDIMLNNELYYGPFSPNYLNQTTLYSRSGTNGGNFNLSIVKHEKSTLPPILNAFEIYKLVNFSQSETAQNDVDAITKIKSEYGVKRNWEADPCLPVEYLWAGLNCSYDNLEPPRITSLNLSSSGLIGEISPNISNLTLIESLDFSNNNLSGPVPDFLSQLPNLKILNLERNKLTGSIPAELMKKSESGVLSLSVGENPNLICSSLLCGKMEVKKEQKKNNILVPIIVSVGGVIFLLITSIIIYAVLKRNKNNPVQSNDPLASKKRAFAYSEIVRITNNFERTLGRGGFGTVYLGSIDKNTRVAVKLLSPPRAVHRNIPQSQTEEHDSRQDFYQQQFEAEVTLLMKVHHANLIGLVGYCNDEEHKALIYEFMANGDLESHILGDNKNQIVLNWEERLRIAIDSAQGLEYLHNGCKPQIVHRDVKCTNILLNERFKAKIADFGLSKVFPSDDEKATHVSTKIAGTCGYLDPEYYSTNWLNEKSDVFSFGVVLLEIITGRPAISRNEERTHVIQWVKSMLSNGDIKSIIEPRLCGEFETNSVWKAVELAMACVSRAPKTRPTMSQVVAELKDCLAAELARRNNGRPNESSMNSVDDFRSANVSPNNEMRPLAR